VSKFIRKMEDNYIDSTTIKSYLYSKRFNGYQIVGYQGPYKQNDRLDVLRLK
jgi:hypothetical protein